MAQAQDTRMGHNIAIPGGGPVLNLRGFFDFNFGVDGPLCTSSRMPAVFCQYTWSASTLG